MAKNLANIHKNHLYEEDYEGFGGTFLKHKKKSNENVEIKRSKNVTTTRFKAKEYKNYEKERDYYFD